MTGYIGQMSYTDKKIAVVDYHGALKSSVLGMGDLLRFANGPSRSPSRTQLRIDTVDVTARPETQYDAIVLPPAQDVPDLSFCPWMTNWLLAQHASGAIICSVCAGAFWLVETGLLDDRKATTHWGLEQQISRGYPKVHLDVSQLLIEHTDVVTAGGMMAWMDLCLLLIERFLGREDALATARHFVIDPSRKDQRRFKRFLPDLSHEDDLVRKAQHEMETHYSTRKSIVDIAQKVGIAPRTFQRRFARVTGLLPKDYIQHLRVEKARSLLLQTSRPISDVAYEVGYQDQTAFARVFLKIAGETPSAFRSHYKIPDTWEGS